MRAWSSATVGAVAAMARDWLLVVATIFDDFQLLGAFVCNKSRRWRYSRVIRSRICWFRL
jgi:hypothetical protein